MSIGNVRDMSERVNSTKIKTLNQIKLCMDLSWVEKKDYKVLTKNKDILMVRDEILKKGFYAFDTETTGLNIFNMDRDDPNRDILVGLCISWKEDQGVYIPLEHINFPNANKKFVFETLKDVFEKVPCVTHNGLFDGKVMYAEGIKLNIAHDTLMMLFDIDSDITHFPRGLKHLIEYFFGYSPIEFEDIFTFEKDYRLFRYVDEEVVRIYGCSDADGTLKCFMKLFPLLQKVHRRGYKRHMELLPHIIRSEYEGKTIDIEELQRRSDINKKDLVMIEDVIYHYVGAELAYKVTGKLSPQIYKFNLNSGPELSSICFNKLKYPRKNDRGLDKSVLRWWADTRTDDIGVVAPFCFKENIISNDGKTVLLEKEALYHCKYRMALLIQLYRKLAKNQSSFFDPILGGIRNGKYFTSINLARAATYRMIDNIQTLDGNLKKVVAPPEGCYQIGYDYCQIEARCMVGLAGFKEYVDMLDNPEADYHTISAAVIEKIKPIFVTKKLRKKYKPVNFGIPYGIGPKSMLEQGKGIGLSPEEYKEALADVVDAIAKWKVGMAPVWNMLERARDNALTPLDDENEKPFYMRGKEVGRVMSPYGRARYFNLENLTESGKASIRRKAGNFPIQSFAFDIYIEGIIKLGNCLVSEGLMDIKVPDDYSPLGYHFENKVVFREYVHDEVQMTIDKSINPKWMMKKIYENCIIHIEGHPTYYIGVSIVKNWGESKAGDHEVPFAWLESIPDDVPKYGGYTETIQHDIDVECSQFIKNRTVEEFAKLGKDIWTLPSMTVGELFEFESYYLIGKMCDYFKDGRRKAMKEDKCGYNDEFVASLEVAFGHPIEIIGGNTVKTEDDMEEEKDEQTVVIDWYSFWQTNVFDDNEEEEVYSIIDDIPEDSSSEEKDNKVTYSTNLNKNLMFLQSLVGGKSNGI